MVRLFCLCALCCTGAAVPEEPPDPAPEARETVVLLHGMGRTRVSMKVLEYRLRNAGYETLNFPYSVRNTALDTIVANFHQFLDENVKTGRYHLIGHSLGNIVIRAGFKDEYPPGLGRIVMLAPPNQPAALAQRLEDNPVFKFFTNDAGQKLGSGDFYADLPTPTVEFGILAGDKGQPFTFDGPNDGIVAVENTKLEGAKGWKILHHTHTFIMNAKDTAQCCINFLRHGQFDAGGEK